MADDAGRLRDRPALVGLTVGLAVVETAVVSVLGPVTGLALAPQVSAPTPLGAFHDLRWIAVYTPSWLALVAALLAFVVVRTAITAATVTLAWPAGLVLPGLRWRVRRALVATVVTSVVLLPSVVLIFATAVFSLSYLWIVAVPVVVMVSVVVHAAAVSETWWQSWPRAAAIGAVLAAFAGLGVLGAVIAMGPPFARWPAAALAGALNAWCWLRITHAVAGHAARRSRPPFAVVALASILVLVLGGAALGFAAAGALEGRRRPAPRLAADAAGPPVLVVRGFDSAWDGTTRRWLGGDFRVRRFSYAGLDRAREPRPYRRVATHASLRVLARRMHAQVDALAAATGQPVGIVAESEGALVALTYLLGSSGAPVASVVVLSPLPQPGRVSYPASGRLGWGIAGGAALDAVGAVVDGIGPVTARADTPLFRSIVSEAPLLQGLLRCPAPGVRELAILPVDTGLAAPLSTPIGIPSVVRPAFHGGLLGDATAARAVRAVLRGRAVDTSTRWTTVEHVVRGLASPWQVPSLAPSLQPRWRHLPDPDDCAGVRRGLRAYLGG